LLELRVDLGCQFAILAPPQNDCNQNNDGEKGADPTQDNQPDALLPRLFFVRGGEKL
jgi:hypothetical protein